MNFLGTFLGYPNWCTGLQKVLAITDTCDKVDKHPPLRTKLLRGNQAFYASKAMLKAIMKKVSPGKKGHKKRSEKSL